MEWINVKDKPLFIDFEGWFEITNEGQQEFLAAVPYIDSKRKDDNLWLVRHCLINDYGKLCVVTDDDTELAGWELSDVTHWMPLPKPPEEKTNTP